MTATDKPQTPQNAASRLLWKGKAHEMPRLSEGQDIDPDSPHYIKGISYRAK